MSELAPTVAARVRYAKALLEGSQDRAAADVLRQAVALAPDSAEIRLLLAQALTGSDRGDEAEVHLRRALKDASTEASANGMLGYWYQSRGHFSEAKACFERSIELDPKQSVSYYGWIQGNSVSIADTSILEKVAGVLADSATQPDDAMILRYVLGKGYADIGDYAQSIQQFDLANEAAFQLNLTGKPFKRGQYAELFDKTMATFKGDLFDRHRRAGLNSRLPIFVLGMMRSGTTLVEQILSSHPEVGAGGEVEFWVDEGPKCLDLNKRSVNVPQMVRMAQAYAKHLQSLAPRMSKVVDKMPQNFQMAGLIHLAFPKAPIIHIRRNPIDNCLSIYTTAYQRSPAFAHDRESIVFAYKQYKRLLAHWRNVLPADQFLEIDYEDLVIDRESVIRRLIDHCGLEWSNRCLHPEENDRLVVTPSLWQVRQPMYQSSIERWRVYEPWLGAFRELLPEPEPTMPC